MKMRPLLAVLVLSTALLFFGQNVVQADPPSNNPGQPFDQILTLLQQLHSTFDLRHVTQNWDKKLLANDSNDPCNSSRFTCVLDGAAVRDNETGLVWEKSPIPTSQSDWSASLFTCADRSVGGRKGWRAPAYPELASLVDPSVASPGPTLPPGHPFTNVQSFIYFSATTWAHDPNDVWVVNFNTGFVTPNPKSGPNAFLWCVRGPMQESLY